VIIVPSALAISRSPFQPNRHVDCAALGVTRAQGWPEDDAVRGDHALGGDLRSLRARHAAGSGMNPLDVYTGLGRHGRRVEILARDPE
jgi:hypothetical protein